MLYVTTRRRPSYHQMTIDELLDPEYIWRPGSNDKTITVTSRFDFTPARLWRECPTQWYIDKLAEFNNATASLREKDRASLYETFYIPKSSGGMRRIDAPLPELSDALRSLKVLFEDTFHALYHTSAFAYVKGRCTVDAVKRHQLNQSMWFGKFDLHDFFGSTTLDFVTAQMEQIYPFSQVLRYKDGRKELRTALELGFLNGGLPQGTPLSPTLTNIMMIPVDFELSKALRERFPTKNFVYTRYADDFHISSKNKFNIKSVEKTILEVLRQFNAPFSLNTDKTHYGSRNGKNWMLGVMLNGDNNITIGHKKKDQFRAALTNFARDFQSGKRWGPSEIMYVLGLLSYYDSVEHETIEGITAYVNKKVGLDTVGTMKSIIAGKI